MTHFFDTATDIALVMEWYNLYQLQENSNDGTLESYLKSTNVDMKSMFICGLAVLIYYRLTSAYMVYKLSYSKIDCILQFLFDFYLIKAIYVNIYKMKSHKSLSFIKTIRGFEGDTESAFQSILALLFLIKINQTDPIAIASFCTSLYSLISRYIYADYSYSKISKPWLKHIIFRFGDISTNVLIIALAWHLLDGIALSIIFGVIIFCLEFLPLLVGQSIKFTFVSLFVRMPFGVIWFSRTRWGLVYFEKYIFGFVRIILCIIMIVTAEISKENSSNFVEFAVYGVLINSTVILPVYFAVFIWPIYVPSNDRTFVSYGFSDVNAAIRVSDIDFLLFCKLMGVNPFYNYYKYKSLVSRYMTRLLSYYWFMGTATSMVISLARQPKFDHQIFMFLKEWYNELHAQEKTVSFEEFLALEVSTGDEIIASMVYTNTSQSNNIEIWNILDKTGKIDWNSLKYTIGCDCRYNWWYHSRMIHWVVFRSSVNVVKWYLENSECDVNATTKTGTTAMHVLMKRINSRGWTDDEREIATLLVKQGVDLTKRDSDGRTARDCLREKYKQEYDQLLCVD